MLIRAFAFAYAFMAVSAFINMTSGSCETYPSNSFCSNYINYRVYLPSGSTIGDIETSLTPYNYLQYFSETSPSCLDTFTRYLCSKAYPKCETTPSNKTNIYTACLSGCQETNNVCGSILRLTDKGNLLPDCSSEKILDKITLQPDSSCNNIPTKMTQEQFVNGKLNFSAIPAGFLIKQCPSPFVKDTLASTGKTLSESFCDYGCCIPCPVQNYVYKKGWAKVEFAVPNIVRFVAAFLSLFLVISYLVLPFKRRHPSALILNLSISIFLFSMTSFFAIGNPEKLQCSPNGVTPAEIGNNALCAAQGAILVFASFATVLWCSALILNLHLSTVWSSSFFADKYIILNIICWGIPTGMTCLAIGFHALKFEFSSLCLISIEYVFKIFFYPLAALICPSFLIHVCTFFYIAKIAIQEKLEYDRSQSQSSGNATDVVPGVSRRHIIAAVKIQWRALLMAVVGITTILFYWLAYMVQVDRFTDTERDGVIVERWIQCMLLSEGDQNKCYEFSKNWLPSFPLMITVDIFASLIGFWLFILFAKRSLWREWNDWIYDFRIANFGSSREKRGEQFYTL
ncbi:hypothetical protein BY458DRAFT_455346 [Sporodiniella umbellata]|nr:hypothetical protein BY458DRAFT_455346 [Sporodiniella umbellata]